LTNPNSLKIIYLTELEPDFSLSQECERIQYFYERHFSKMKIARSGRHYKGKYIDVSDCGILLGNSYTSKTYEKKIKKIFLLNPTGLINPRYSYYSRKTSKSKKNFVWFGSGGAIHKGVDILIDTFKENLEVNLYICGLNKQEKMEMNMGEYPNIVDLGFVDVNSELFLWLVNQCSYVILPSCSEGMATSVLTCMNHSLIPVVTKETGIDIFDFGIEIGDFHVEHMKNIIKRACSLSDEEVENMHKKVFQYAREKFTIERFTGEFDMTMEEILKEYECRKY